MTQAQQVTNWEVRPLAREQVDIIYRINSATQYFQEFSNWSQDKFDRTYPTYSYVFSAWDGEMPIGFATAVLPGTGYTCPYFRWSEENLSDFLYFDRMAVHSDYLRRGVASAMTAKVAAVAKELRVAKMASPLFRPQKYIATAEFLFSWGFAPVKTFHSSSGNTIQMVTRPVH